MKHLAIFLALIPMGCAHLKHEAARDMARDIAMDARSSSDDALAIIRAHIDERYVACEPVVSQGRAALDRCHGPVASNPDAVDAAVEALRTAQLAVWSALLARDGVTVEEIVSAARALTTSTRELLELAKKAKAK